MLPIFSTKRKRIWREVIERYLIKIAWIWPILVHIGTVIFRGGSNSKFDFYRFKFNYLIKDDEFFENRDKDCSKQMVVKRRYKEFVDLQSKLEENTELKSFLKSINGPSKFLSIPIYNMDEDIVERRRKKLNDYLKVNFCYFWKHSNHNY